MPRGTSFETMIEYLSSIHCSPNFDREWYEANYQSIYTSLPIICQCGRAFKRSMSSLKVKIKSPYRVCSHCKTKGVSKEESRLAYENLVKQIKANKGKPDFNLTWFRKNYKNSQTIIPLICACGNGYTKSVTQFHIIPTCQNCIKQAKRVEMYQTFLAVIEATDCKPSFDEKWFLANYEQQLAYPFVCTCSKPFRKTMDMFKRNPRCNECKTHERKRKEATIQYEKVIKLMESSQSELLCTKEWFLTNYQDVNAFLPLRCSCGSSMEKRIKAFNYANKIRCETCVKYAKQRFVHKVINQLP